MSSSVEEIATSAPRSSASLRLSSVLAVAMTRPAPHSFASCTAIEPTPPAAACTTTLSPSARCALLRSSSHAVAPCTTRLSAVRSSTPSGTSNVVAAGATAFCA